MTNIEISLIRIDGGTQSRAALDDDVVNEYSRAIRDGTDFPPVVLFFDGKQHWLADGFHRFHAYKQAGAKGIAAEIRMGTVRDAKAYALGANEDHGLRRTIADRRCAVEMALADEEWGTWSDRKIAAMCKVSHPFVAKVRAEVTGNISSENAERTYTTKHGTTAKMDTAKIGKSEKEKAKAENAAKQAELDRQRDENRAKLDPKLQRRIQAQEDARAIAAKQKQPADDGLSPEDRLTELEEANRLLEEENAALKETVAKFSKMEAEYKAGGFEEIIAGKDEEIRVLETRLYRESEDKASWMKSSKFWKAEAIKLGYSNDVVIDIETGEVVNG
ncbi:hypothetical protein [uncultured Nitratireductor sp.]|uniref:hypothetical protein n=1 Tax=uncultured Nitratireductor sp. TaxID=520953 RepID=UPI0026139814|nr:hypothetical protein [uncultured Nitratireductor sp.]